MLSASGIEMSLWVKSLVGGHWDNQGVALQWISHGFTRLDRLRECIKNRGTTVYYHNYCSSNSKWPHFLLFRWKFIQHYKSEPFWKAHNSCRFCYYGIEPNQSVSLPDSVVSLSWIHVSLWWVCHGFVIKHVIFTAIKSLSLSVNLFRNCWREPNSCRFCYYKIESSQFVSLCESVTA